MRDGLNMAVLRLSAEQVICSMIVIIDDEDDNKYDDNDDDDDKSAGLIQLKMLWGAGRTSNSEKSGVRVELGRQRGEE